MVQADPDNQRPDTWSSKVGGNWTAWQY